MRKFLLLIWLIPSLVVSAQKDPHSLRKQRPSLIANDSVLYHIVEQKDSIVKAIKIQEDSVRVAMDKFKADEKKLEERQRTRNMIGIGIGLVLLVVLIAGLIRRKKK